MSKCSVFFSLFTKSGTKRRFIDCQQFNWINSIFHFPGGVTDEPVEFIVDAGSSNANITAEAISPNGTRQRCQVKNTGDGKHKVQFTPQGTGSHRVSIAVNGTTLPGEPIEIPVEKKPEQEELIASEYNKGNYSILI